MKNFIISALLISCFSMTASAQTSFGFRTGLNFNTFLGELEEGESFGTNTGFHIGLAFNRQFTDIWGVRAELVFSQKGTSNTYEGNSSVILLDEGNNRSITHSGLADINLSVTNTYVDLPLSGYGRVASWLEVSLGVVPGFLVASRGRGDLNLDASSLNEELVLTLDHNYYRDNPGEAADSSEGLVIAKERATAKELSIPSTLGAYTFQEEDNGSLYNAFNLDAVFGLSVFVNSGLYIGGRVQYGLLDVTNNDADFSFDDITVSRSDKDVNLVFQGSVGFNF